MRIVLLLAALVLSAGPAGAADKVPAKKDSTGAPVQTHHQIRASGKSVRYTVTTGKLPLKNEAGDTEAEIFFMAYTLDGTGKGTASPSSRPLMFSFNGGPGSSSVWRQASRRTDSFRVSCGTRRRTIQ